MTSILEDAQTLIHGQRNKDYGHPRENFGHTAELFSAYLGVEVTALDVAQLMILLKMSRQKGTGYHRDSTTDIAGYAGCMERVYEEPEEADDELADWEKELLGVPTGDSFFLDHIDQPVTPRVWERKDEAPGDVVLRGQGGEIWKWYEDQLSWLWSTDGGKVDYTRIGEGPYTEVLP